MTERNWIDLIGRYTLSALEPLFPINAILEEVAAALEDTLQTDGHDSFGQQKSVVKQVLPSSAWAREIAYQYETRVGFSNLAITISNLRQYSERFAPLLGDPNSKITLLLNIGALQRMTLEGFDSDMQYSASCTIDTQYASIQLANSFWKLHPSDVKHYQLAKNKVHLASKVEFFARPTKAFSTLSKEQRTYLNTLLDEITNQFGTTTIITDAQIKQALFGYIASPQFFADATNYRANTEYMMGKASAKQFDRKFKNHPYLAEAQELHAKQEREAQEEARQKKQQAERARQEREAQEKAEQEKARKKQAGASNANGEAKAAENRFTSTDLYAVLNVSSQASPTEIAKSYRELIKKLHPDLVKDGAKNELCKKVNYAYEILSDSDKRRQYDLFLSKHRNERTF